MKKESNLKTKRRVGNTLFEDDPMQPKIFYYPLLFYKWSSLKVDNFGVQIPINTHKEMGDFFIPVFESEQECKKHYPNCSIKMLV